MQPLYHPWCTLLALLRQRGQNFTPSQGQFLPNVAECHRSIVQKVIIIISLNSDPIIKLRGAPRSTYKPLSSTLKVLNSHIEGSKYHIPHTCTVSRHNHFNCNYNAAATHLPRNRLASGPGRGETG